MRNQYKILAEKYDQVADKAPDTPKAPKAPEPAKEEPKKDSNIGELLSNLSNILSTEDRESSEAFNQFLLSLLNSTNVAVKSAAADALNKQPQVAMEDDEVLDNPHSSADWPNTSGAGAGY